MAKEKGKGLFGEFKTFIARGNVVDMAVGVIMGGAFTPIVNSIVNDIIMPCVGKLFGDMDFSQYRIVLQEAVVADEANGIAEVAEIAIRYGNLITILINFLLVALCVFLLVKGINKLHRKKEEAPTAPAEPPKPSDEVVLLTEIRDLLEKQKKNE